MLPGYAFAPGHGDGCCVRPWRTHLKIHVLLYCGPAVKTTAAARVMTLKIDDAINVGTASRDTTP